MEKNFNVDDQDYYKGISIYESAVNNTGLLLNEEDSIDKLRNYIYHKEELKELIVIEKRESLNEIDKKYFDVLIILIEIVENKIQVLERLNHNGLLIKETKSKIFLTTACSKNCLTDIFLYLYKTKNINTDLETWLAWFNLYEDNNPLTMNWTGTSNLLANVMHQICGVTIKKTIIEAFGINDLPKQTNKVYLGQTVGIAIKNIIDRNK